MAGCTTSNDESKVVQSFNTFDIMPDGIAANYNNDPGYTKTFATTYQTTDNGDGTSNFSMDEIIGGLQYDGVLETATQKIISVTCTYNAVPNIDDTVNTNLGMMILPKAAEVLLNMPKDDCMGFVMETSQKENRTQIYNGAVVEVGKDTKGNIIMSIKLES